MAFAPFPRAFYTENSLLLNLHKNDYVYSLKVLIINKVPSRISGLYFLVYCRKEAIKNLSVLSGFGWKTSQALEPVHGSFRVEAKGMSGTQENSSLSSKIVGEY